MAVSRKIVENGNVMKRQRAPFSVSILLAFTTLQACSDDQVQPFGPEEQGHDVVSGFALSTELQDVREVRVDLPPSPRPWDSDDEALERVVAEAKGMVTIGLKDPVSARVLENDGFRAGMGKRQFQAGIEHLLAEGVKVTRVFRRIGAVGGIIDPKKAGQIRKSAWVDYVEPEMPGGVAGTRLPSVAMAAHHRYFSQTTPWGVTMVKAPQAWSKTTGNGVRIMIIDTGHDQGHEDLPSVASGRCGGLWDGCDDDMPHGTHVLGDFAARNNSLGSVGVAPGVANADVFAYGACDEDGDCSDLEMIDGLEMAVDSAVDVVNMSIAKDYHLGVANAVSDAWQEDIVLVAAAGNNVGQYTRYPAGLGQVIGVSGVRTNKSFASSSPCGLGSYSNHGVHVELSAPFWSYNAVPGDDYEDEDDGWCGTSFASPHVAGAAALIRALAPGLENYKVWDRLTHTAEDRGASGYDQYYGEGLLRVYEALGPWTDFDGPDHVKPNQICE